METRNGTTMSPSGSTPDSSKGAHYKTFMNEDPWEFKNPEMAAQEEARAKAWAEAHRAKQQPTPRAKLEAP